MRRGQIEERGGERELREDEWGGRERRERREERGERREEKWRLMPD